jgi:uncharacterized protein with HEPN domain
MKQPHSIPQSLSDIRDAIAAIEKFLGPTRNYYRFLEDELLRSAVELKLEIIGEATGRIIRADPSFPIPNARKIVDTRNRVIHGYDSIDNEAVWLIVVRHLPPLKAEVEKLLAQ